MKEILGISCFHGLYYYHLVAAFTSAKKLHILDILNRKFYKLKGREGKSEHECLCDFYGERKVECLLINEERKLHKNKEGSLDVHKSKGERKLG